MSSIGSKHFCLVANDLCMDIKPFLGMFRLKVAILMIEAMNDHDGNALLHAIQQLDSKC